MNPALAKVPGHGGWPGLRTSLAIVRDPRALMARCQARHGSVFRLFARGRWVVFALGAEHNAQVLVHQADRFGATGGWSGTLGATFPGALLMRDGAAHVGQRRALAPAFRGDALRGYLSQAAPVIDRALSDLPRRLQFYPRVKQLTLDIAARAFLGLEQGAESAAINRALTTMALGTVALIRAPIPGGAAWRGRRAQRWLEQRLLERVAARRGSGGADALSALAAARLPDGGAIDPLAVVRHMTFLLFAGHDTSTSSICTTAWALAEHPTWQSLAREACAELAADGSGPPDAIALLDRVFDESLRLEPPVPFIPRQTLAPVELGGYALPEGAIVVVSPDVTHRAPEHWAEPQRFDPDRFLREPLGERSRRFAYLPFGLGAHRCLGETFARLEHRALLRALLLRYRLTLPPGHRVRWQQVPIPRPRCGLPLVLDPVQPALAGWRASPRRVRAQAVAPRG